MKKTFLISFLLCAACSPQAGPDKTLGGAALGAAWGAGAGAVVGNQVYEFPRAGEGAAIGAGFGLVSGAMQGAGYDVVESTQIRQQKEIDAMQVKNMANGRQLAMLQARLDNQSVADLATNVYQVFFDTDVSNLKSGSIANIEIIADAIKRSPRIASVNVIGHSDDSGDPKYNKQISEARARNVAAYLAGRGISSDDIKVKSYGAKRPIAPNTTPTGRQLNRRVEVFIETN